jgi:hypothetical protein
MTTARLIEKLEREVEVETREKKGSAESVFEEAN